MRMGGIERDTVGKKGEREGVTHIDTGGRRERGRERECRAGVCVCEREKQKP